MRVGQGQLEFGKVISLLNRENYDRALSVDIRDIPDTGYPMEPEVRKLKYLLDSMISSDWSSAELSSFLCRF